MEARVTVAEVAAATRKHPVTVRLAAEAGELHGTQSKKGGRWSFKAVCVDAWADRVPCPHHASNVTSIKRAVGA